MSPRHCRRRDRRRRLPNYLREPFLADEMWTVSSNPHFSWFCKSAYFVDEYEPVTFMGIESLALRAHIPPSLARLALVSSLEDLEFITEQFDALPFGNDSLWRCDVRSAESSHPVFAIAGNYDDRLLAQLREASLLVLIDVAMWERWTSADAHLVLRNDQDFWESCTR